LGKIERKKKKGRACANHSIYIADLEKYFRKKISFLEPGREAFKEGDLFEVKS